MIPNYFLHHHEIICKPRASGDDPRVCMFEHLTLK